MLNNHKLYIMNKTGNADDNSVVMTVYHVTINKA